jgi:hypothetical protein
MLVKKRGIVLKGLNNRSPGMSELYDSEMFLPEETPLPAEKKSITLPPARELVMEFIAELEETLSLFPEPAKQKPSQGDLFTKDND